MIIITRRSILKTALAAPVLMATAQSASAATHQVAIESFEFNSPNLAIKAGDTVQFINSDGAPHTATADDGSFDTGQLNKGNSADVTFANAGTFDYFCEYHPEMKAVISVSG